MRYYRCLQLPVHLLLCDDTGAVQLQIMTVPDYRRKLTQAALKNQYRPPPKDIPAWDALFQGMPFVMAADMDLRRIDAAIQTASANNMKQIAIAALERQAESVLFFRPWYERHKAKFPLYIPLGLTAWYFYGMLLNFLKLGRQATFHLPGQEVPSIWVVNPFNHRLSCMEKRCRPFCSDAQVTVSYSYTCSFIVCPH